MKVFLLACAVLLVLAMGAVGIVHGEADDSPGLQLLGALFVIGGIVLGVRLVRQRREPRPPPPRGPV
ncbi:MAG: hypothetical protein OJJ54_05235 [Pseudonocardia sp.]|nr:hypothetical protein [Pseudonocardia sp.]